MLLRMGIMTQNSKTKKLNKKTMYYLVFGLQTQKSALLPCVYMLVVDWDSVVLRLSSLKLWI